MGKGLTEIRGNVEMEPCDWLLANEDVSRLSGDCGGVMRLGLLHSECEREPGFRGRVKQKMRPRWSVMTGAPMKGRKYLGFTF